MSVGTVHLKRVLFMRIHVGEAKAKESGITYELSTNVGGGGPIVHSDKTDRYFTLSWQDIVDLAIEAGIDEPEKKPKKKKESTE